MNNSCIPGHGAGFGVGLTSWGEEGAAQERRELRGYPPLRAGHPLTAWTVKRFLRKGIKKAATPQSKQSSPKGGGQRWKGEGVVQQWEYLLGYHDKGRGLWID